MSKKSSADHRADAERCLAEAEAAEGDSEAVLHHLQRAQVHALLGLSRSLEERREQPPKDFHTSREW